jgi:hypothetical protein
MIQKHRISTNIGKDQIVKVELKQDFDLLEILSLKFTQKEIYTSLCADYGVVCGRITVNNGLGVPNARVSIFIPLSQEDEQDPVISTLYPFKTVSDKNDNNYRYNLLPSRKQHGGHAPTGTFFDQSDILTREEVLEVYEKYYKYTVKTNNAGDFMIWGVPLGEQTIHVDLDLSDIGCFSFRPYDFIKQGLGPDQFKNTYEYKSSVDLDSLPQIVSFNKSIDVYPFWGNEDICEIGLTRTDFDLSNAGVKIEPAAFFIGGTYTDTGKNSVNKNCQPRRKMGRKCDLITKTGTIEAIRFTPEKDENNRPKLELFDIQEDIPEDGSFVFSVPMNMDYVFTNEFGENEITNDTNKGVPTASCYRFRFSLDDAGNERTRKTASYLVPNIREYSTDEDKSYAFSTNYSDYPIDAVNNNIDRGMLYSELGQYYPRDYFYRMTYNKVYTMSSFQNIHYNGDSFSNDRYVGLKEIVPTEEEDCSSDIVTPPVNFGKKNFTFTLLISDVLLFFEQLINLVTLTFFNAISRIFHQFADAVNFWPIRKLSNRIKKFAYSIQDSTQRSLYLISYPECQECNGEDSLGVQGGQGSTLDFCQVGTLTINGSEDQTNRILTASNVVFSVSNVGDCSTNAVPITGGTDFINRQTEYFLESQSFNIGLTSTSFTYDSVTGTYTFDDVNGVFNEVTTPYNVIIRDKNNTASPFTITTPIESDCDLFDVPYDESLVSIYYTLTGGTTNIERGGTTTYVPGMDVTSSNISDSGYQLLTNFDGETYTPITKSGFCEFSNGSFHIIPGSLTTKRLFNILKEYRKRKRVGTLFCGGIVNYSFVDNWLSGSLYFFLFKGRRGNYCRQIVRFITSQNRFYYRSALYNSTSNTWGDSGKSTRVGRPTTMVDLGPRDEFIKEICIDPSLDPNCSVTRQIGPTSFQNFGEILGMAINYRLDTTNANHDINDFFDNNGFGYTTRVFDGDLLQLISINNEVGIEEFDLQNPRYLGYSYQFLDPELYPEVFKNGTNVWGPLPITFYLSDDGERVRSCLNEPTHVANDGVTNVQGRLTESSQKVPFFLWDKGGPGFGPYNNSTVDDQSWDYGNIQVQPLQGMTHGYNLTSPSDDSSDKYLLLPMTYTFSGVTVDTGNATNDVEFDVVETGVDNHALYDNEYPGYTYLHVTSGTVISPSSGTLYTRYGTSGTWHSQPWDFTDDFIIRKTQDYYSGNKQILSTPFMFYFGLRVGKTGVDKFIEYFGDKGAFTSAE